MTGSRVTKGTTTYGAMAAQRQMDLCRTNLPSRLPCHHPCVDRKSIMAVTCAGDR